MMEQKPAKGFYQTGNDEYHDSSSVLCTLFLFSFAMFTLPIASYYATIYLFEEYFHIPQSESYIYAVVSSVVVVHVILIAYIFKAFNEDKKNKTEWNAEYTFLDWNYIDLSFSVPRYVRVNTLVCSVEDVVKVLVDEGWLQVKLKKKSDYAAFLERVKSLSQEEFLIDYHLDFLLVFPAKTQFHEHHLMLDGSLFLQDKVSQF